MANARVLARRRAGAAAAACARDDVRRRGGDADPPESLIGAFRAARPARARRLRLAAVRERAAARARALVRLRTRLPRSRAHELLQARRRPDAASRARARPAAAHLCTWTAKPRSWSASRRRCRRAAAPHTARVGRPLGCTRARLRHHRRRHRAQLSRHACALLCAVARAQASLPENTFLLVDRGGCTFTAKALHAQALGAAAVSTRRFVTSPHSCGAARVRACDSRRQAGVGCSARATSASACRRVRQVVLLDNTVEIEDSLLVPSYDAASPEAQRCAAASASRAPAQRGRGL